MPRWRVFKIDCSSVIINNYDILKKGRKNYNGVFKKDLGKKEKEIPSKLV